MRILNVFMLFSAMFALVACSSGTRGTDLQGTGTGYNYVPGDTQYYGDQYYDPNFQQYGGYYDDLPQGTVPAVFGYDYQQRDWTVFLGFIFDPSNSYSLCNQGNWSQFRNSQYGQPNPYEQSSAYNPSAQVPPTIWNYDTNSGYATFVGYLRKGGQTDPDTVCGYGAYY